MADAFSYLTEIFDWIEHHGTVVSVLSLGTGSVGALAWQKFENQQQITIEQNAVSVTHGGVEDIKVVFVDKNHSEQTYVAKSLNLITISIRNTGKKDLKEPFSVTLEVPKGGLLRCKPGGSSLGVSCPAPELSLAQCKELDKTEFEVPRLKKGEFIEFQIYLDTSDSNKIDVRARPMDVDVRYRRFGDEPKSPSIRFLFILAGVFFGVAIARGFDTGAKSTSNISWPGAISLMTTGFAIILTAIYVRIRLIEQSLEK